MNRPTATKEQSVGDGTGPQDVSRGRDGEILAAGVVAPPFTLHVTPDQTLSLKDLRGRPAILAFYPADWSPVCGDQMALYNEILPEFQTFGAHAGCVR